MLVLASFLNPFFIQLSNENNNFSCVVCWKNKSVNHRRWHTKPNRAHIYLNSRKHRRMLVYCIQFGGKKMSVKTSWIFKITLCNSNCATSIMCSFFYFGYCLFCFHDKFISFILSLPCTIFSSSFRSIVCALLSVYCLLELGVCVRVRTSVQVSLREMLAN